MPTAPTKLPRWATGGSAVVTEPTEGVKDTGSAPGYPIPAGHFNWLHENIYDWLNYLSQVGVVYTSLPSALDDLSAGDMAIIDEYDGNHLPGSKVSGANNPTTSNPTVSLDTSGDITVYLDSGGVAKAIKSRWTDANFTGSDIVATYTLTSFATTARVIRTNGEYTVVAYDNHAEIFNATTGASIADINHGAAVYDVCLDGVRMYLVGASGTGTKTVRCITLSSGASVWTYDHGATTYSCCTDGRRLFIAGAASGHASTATHRALEAATGEDAANEGGTSASTWPDVWDLAHSNTVGAGQRLVTDGRFLFAAYTSAMSNQIERIGTAAGLVQASWDIGENVLALAIDHTAILAATANNIVCLDKVGFPNVRWTFDDDGQAICTDGFMVTFGGATAGLVMNRRYRRNTPARIRKVAPPDQYNPYRWIYQIAGE